jgi:hypothetical protein
MVIPVITFVKGDAKSRDTLISRFGGKNCIARVPRMCLCGKADLDNPLHRCLWIHMAYQRELNEKVAQLSVPPETCPGKPPEILPSEESTGKGDEGIHGRPGCHVGSSL